MLKEFKATYLKKILAFNLSTFLLFFALPSAGQKNIIHRSLRQTMLSYRSFKPVQMQRPLLSSATLGGRSQPYTGSDRHRSRRDLYSTNSYNHWHKYKTTFPRFMLALTSSFAYVGNGLEEENATESSAAGESDPLNAENCHEETQEELATTLKKWYLSAKATDEHRFILAHVMEHLQFDANLLSHSILICNPSGKLVSLGLINLNALPAREAVELNFLVSSPIDASKGKGKAVIRQIIKQMSKTEKTEIILSSLEQSVGFYRHLGFKSTAAVNYFDLWQQCKVRPLMPLKLEKQDFGLAFPEFNNPTRI